VSVGAGATRGRPSPGAPPVGGVSGLLVGAALGLLAAVAKVPVNLASGGDVGLLPLVIGVGIATWYGNRVGGVAATAVSAVVDTWLFALQGGDVVLAGPRHWAALLLYLVVGLLAVVLVATLRDSREREHADARARDLLNAKLAEREGRLETLLEQERQAKRMRDAFIDIVSHELRTPITLIVGSARLLGRSTARLEDREAGLVREIEDGGDRLARLVEDLVILVRSERESIAAASEPVRLESIVSRVVAVEARRWPNMAFEQSLEPGLPLVRGSDRYIEQVLANLLSNAAKYNLPGGGVQVQVIRDARGVVVRVLDDGPGIAESEAQRLFDLYYRSDATARSVGGSGIGLYVSRRLVEAMGGRIGVMRRPEGGSVFEVTLAEYDGDAPEAGAAPAPDVESAREVGAPAGTGDGTGAGGAVADAGMDVGVRADADDDADPDLEVAAPA
jgi:signal transduction histidine kinase